MLAIFHQVLGGILFLAGLVVLPLPIPFGLIMIVIGLALLAPYIIPVQNVIRTLRRKNASINEKLIRWRSNMPPVIQKTIDKTHP
ncbi:PGPGW domain-containing protein [Aquisalinus flavus]|uniref:Transmembrane protein (PGPGW) n=1 Tax=Aquisalinus flavus TaxID=1526572 RepID=A0A8J2Y6X7_9PROT|nr:PGPGW domain-containing protein [Aquisalinus flavus]MBD0426696.1 hypothetical protein [Aquisalinus flavus]UNE46566.1 hypothetical protein FF099_00035 [Aquisalinus flavus]GGC95244.1 hypothetical protein GCM10011342_00070 [Aquisalinus flavus]